MPFEVEQFGGFRTVRGARIRLLEQFCIKEGLEICELCHPSKGRYQIFFIDFSEISKLADDAVAWLSLFLRWAESAGVSVRLVNMTSAHAEQLARIGISEHGTALCDVRSDRFRQLFAWAGASCIMDLAQQATSHISVDVQLERIRESFKAMENLASVADRDAHVDAGAKVGRPLLSRSVTTAEES